MSFDLNTAAATLGEDQIAQAGDAIGLSRDAAMHAINVLKDQWSNGAEEAVKIAAEQTGSAPEALHAFIAQISGALAAAALEPAFVAPIEAPALDPVALDPAYPVAVEEAPMLQIPDEIEAAAAPIHDAVSEAPAAIEAAIAEVEVAAEPIIEAVAEAPALAETAVADVQTAAEPIISLMSAPVEAAADFVETNIAPAIDVAATITENAMAASVEAASDFVDTNVVPLAEAAASVTDKAMAATAEAAEKPLGFFAKLFRRRV